MPTPAIQFGWTPYVDQVQDPELGAFIRAVNLSLRGLWNDMTSQVLYKTALPSTWSNAAGFSVGNRRFLLQDGTAADSPTWGIVTAADVGSGAALTRTNDTNVTLTLGGTPATALLAATSLTLGWTGQLGLARGGTNADLSATGAASNVLKQVSAGAAITVGQLAFSDISGTVANSQLLATYAAITTLANLTTTGALISGSIVSGFGSINVGANAITCGALTATGTNTLAGFLEISTPTYNKIRSTGLLQIEGNAGAKSYMLFRTTESILLEDNSATANITLSHNNGASGNVTIALDATGVTVGSLAFFNNNVSVATGKAYQINAVSVLNATTLGTAVVNSSLTGVGALISGSIVSGFGSINVGANAVTGGAASFTTGAFSGSVGVWVASPGAHLEVVTGTSEARISFAAASGGILQIRGNTGGDSDIQLNAYSGTPLLNFRSSSAVLLATLTNLGVWNMQGNAVSMGALTCTTVGCGAITSTSTIATQDPGQGAGLWKLGKKIVGSGLGIVTNNYVEVMIDGVAVKLAEAA